MPDPHRWATAALAVALCLGTASCGAAKPTQPQAQTVTQCQQQWHDVGQSILGLDQSTDPSGLSSRWTSVIATVGYYETLPNATDCQANIEAQLRAITQLRQFGAQLQPYDMTYQVGQLAADIDLYLHDPLPAPVKGKGGRLISPPSQKAVSAAYRVLSNNAAAANLELQPGYGEMAQLDLGDAAAVQRALADLNSLAQDGTHWQACERALEILVAAVQAQNGTGGASTGPSPTAIPTN